MNIEGFIPLFGGLYVSLMAFGYIAAGKNPQKNEQWLRQYGKLMRIVGPCLVVFGIAMIFRFL